MGAQSFQSVVQSWHDFYLAAGSASAALLGLLFVGVSINLASINASERADLRTRANVAFSNLLYLLAISLVVLIPSVDARSMGISFTAIAIVGLVRLAGRARTLIKDRRPDMRMISTARRMAWTLIADVTLLYIAAQMDRTGDPAWLYASTFVVFVLLIGAADTSWGLLLRESEDIKPSDSNRLSNPTQPGPRSRPGA